MAKHRFARNQKAALEVWKLRGYFNLPNLSMADLTRIYLELHPETRIMCRKNHFKAFLEYFKDFSATELTTTEVKAWMALQMERYDLSEKTLGHLKVQISPLFKWLMEENIITINPLSGIKINRKALPRRQKCILSAEELKHLQLSAKKNESKYLFPYLYSLIHTGARRAEVANLKWKDVDFETSTLTFRQTKNGSDRKVVMSLQLNGVLRKLKKIEHEFVFQNSRGLPINRSTIERMIASFKRSNPIDKDWHLHDLRHSFAYNFLKKGGEMYQLQAILGHKSIQMTIDLYGNMKSHDIENPSPYDF